MTIEQCIEILRLLGTASHLDYEAQLLRSAVTKALIAKLTTEPAV